MTEDALTARIDSYAACWRVMDEAKLLGQLGAVLGQNVRYVDPTTDLHGISALAHHIGAVAADRPNAVIERTSTVDVHHDVARFSWHLVDSDSTKLDGSIDVVVFDADTALIQTIFGFFGAHRPLKG